MKRRKHPLLRISLLGAALLGVLALAAPRPAAAQATISAEAGLQRYYRPDGWVPVRLTLTNQGAPARVEVRARFFAMGKGPQEYRLPQRELPSGANAVHTLYMRSPRSYGTQPITIDLYRDGRVINTVRPRLEPVADDSWFLYGIGPAENTTPLNLLTTANLPARTPAGTGPAPPGRARSRATVAINLPSEAPDRWQGLEAVDAVVVAGASERDFRPEQLAAIREYAVAGGTVVVTGGLNWNRLDTAFFQDLLPVRVTGSSTASNLSGSTFGSPPAGAFPVCTAALKPGSEITLGTPEEPLIVSGKKGSGRVVFMAFDPSLAPFRDWAGTRDVWAEILGRRPQPTLIQAVATADSEYDPYQGMSPPGYYGMRGARLSDAPFSIPQLDIPAFYVVALFLLAYVIILVPVNYFFLKARDKKEYAWITTPAIVLLFSVGAYLIGYGFKGGNTLAIKVGVVEANAGDRQAPFLSYAGLFSPRKTGYNVRFAAANTQQDPFSNALFSEPENTQSQAGLRVSLDDQPRVEDFAVDMWAMRVLKTEGVAELGQGIQNNLRRKGQGIEGSIRNGTPFHLADCVLLSGNEIIAIGDVGPGASLQVNRPSVTRGANPVLLPANLADRYPGGSQKARMRRSVIEALSGASRYNPGNPSLTAAGSELRLVGWIRDPVGRLQVDGRSPKEIAETILVVNL